MSVKKILRSVKNSIFENIKIMGQVGAYVGLFTGFVSIISTYNFDKFATLPPLGFLAKVADFVFRMAAFSLMLSIGLIAVTIIAFTIVGVVKGLTKE